MALVTRLLTHKHRDYEKLELIAHRWFEKNGMEYAEAADQAAILAAEAARLLNQLIAWHAAGALHEGVDSTPRIVLPVENHAPRSPKT